MIPEVAGYKGFKSYSQTPYSILKPGQTQLDRQYYEKVNKEKPSDKTYLQNNSRFSSLYNENQNKTVRLGDFKVPMKDANLRTDYELRHNPELFGFTKKGQQTMTQWGRSQSTGAAFRASGFARTSQGFYKTSYKQQAEQISPQEATRQGQAQRPQWSYNKAAYTSKRGFYDSESGTVFGKYGHNPIQERLKANKERKLAVREDDLS